MAMGSSKNSYRAFGVERVDNDQNLVGGHARFELLRENVQPDRL
jgi:hypothetical protein